MFGITLTLPNGEELTGTHAVSNWLASLILADDEFVTCIQAQSDAHVLVDAMDDAAARGHVTLSHEQLDTILRIARGIALHDVYWRTYAREDELRDAAIVDASFT